MALQIYQEMIIIRIIIITKQKPHTAFCQRYRNNKTFGKINHDSDSMLFIISKIPAYVWSHNQTFFFFFLKTSIACSISVNQQALLRHVASYALSYGTGSPHVCGTVVFFFFVVFLNLSAWPQALCLASVRVDGVFERHRYVSSPKDAKECRGDAYALMRNVNSYPLSNQQQLNNKSIVSRRKPSQVWSLDSTTKPNCKGKYA